MTRSQARAAASSQRAIRADRRRRLLDFTRHDVQQPLVSVSLSRHRGPAQRAGHQASSAHVQAAYPAVADPGLGSRGAYIGDLLRGGPFVYDPWIFYANDILTNANTISIGIPGFGKALACSELIPTPTGWSTMQDLQPGDLVFDEHGRPTPVVSISETMTGRECLEVEFSDGSTIVADAEHLWVTETHADRVRPLKPPARVALGSAEEIAAVRAAIFMPGPPRVTRFALAHELGWHKPQQRHSTGMARVIRASLRQRDPVRAPQSALHSMGPRTVLTYHRETLLAELESILTATRGAHNASRIRCGPITTRDLQGTLRMGDERPNHSIRVAGPLELPPVRLPLAPRLLGLFLGDGDTNGRGFTTADPELLEAFVDAGYCPRPSGPYHYSLARPRTPAPRETLTCPTCESTILPGAYRRVHCSASCASRDPHPMPVRRCSCGALLTAASWHTTCGSCRGRGAWRASLRDAGVLGDKHIPALYLRASIAQRRALLSGLLDTDGTVGNGNVEYCTTLPGLARDVHELVCSLGYRASFNEGRARLNGRDCGPKFNVTFTTSDVVFGLQRKRRVHAERHRGPSDVRTRARYVVDVRPVQSLPVKCIQVANPSGMFLAGRSFIATHNSALSKTYAWRQFLFGRLNEFVDPKGEYAALVEAMGGVTLRLEPGGATRLNPISRVGTQEMRSSLLEAIARAMLGRPLYQHEAVGLVGALRAADDHDDRREVCIPDVVAQLRDPELDAAKHLGMTQSEAQRELRECMLALVRLCEGPLRGMFDGPTTAHERVWDSPGVSIDLSAMNSAATADNLPLGITMVCASAFLDAKRRERKDAAEAAGKIPQKVIRHNDEGWKALPIAGLGEYYQAGFKLSRETGVQHWLVLHRLSDLKAAGDTGSRQQALAEGLLSDASTVIVYRQAPDVVADTANLLGLTGAARDRIGRYGKGVALWKIGERMFEVQHVISDIEWPLIQTDKAMQAA